jgi:hypothetical protein
LPTPASPIPEITDAERAVADLLPLGTDPESAQRVLGRVPLWFHTFALNAEHGLYTPGVARDHRYRVPFLPASFEGQRVLDVGTLTASTPTSPSIAAPRACWRSTTSSTSPG